MFQYVATLVSILLIYGLLKYIKWRKEVYDPLKKLHGPKVYPIIGTLHVFFGAKRPDFFKILRQITEEYGPFFRTFNGFRQEVHLMTPEHLELMLNNSTNIKKAAVYRVLKMWLGDGLLISDGAKWHQRRKMITPTFHFKILEHFMTVFAEKSKLLVEYLEEHSSGKSFDVYPYVTHCALDIICETAMGVSINAMANRNSSYVRALYKTSELIIRKQRSVIKQTSLYPFLKEGRAFYKNLNILHNFTDKVINDRREMLKSKPTHQDQDDVSISKKKRLSFLDLLFDASETLSDADIRDEVDTFMFEGHDTTTAAMCWALFLFAQNQDIQEKAYQEIKSVLGDKTTPESISDLNEMKYLEYCIKESLRLYPSVPVFGRTLTEEIKIDEYTIPKGTEITINVFNLHRNPKIYPNPEKYDPDRFLPENCKGRHAYAYLPFSAGPRNCIGQKFAMYEEKTVLSSILRSYKVLPADTLETITIVSELILRPQDALNIALQKRN